MNMNEQAHFTLLSEFLLIPAGQRVEMRACVLWSGYFQPMFINHQIDPSCVFSIDRLCEIWKIWKMASSVSVMKLSIWSVVVVNYILNEAWLNEAPRNRLRRLCCRRTRHAFAVAHERPRQAPPVLLRIHPASAVFPPTPPPPPRSAAPIDTLAPGLFAEKQSPHVEGYRNAF